MLNKQEKENKAIRLCNEKDVFNPAITRFPSPISEHAENKSDEEKIAYIAKRFSEIMEVLGLDLSDDSLKKTPERVAKMYVKEIFSGLSEKNFPEMTFIKNAYRKEGKSNIVFVKVHFTSFCEHHFVPIVGYAHIAYLPRERLIGLSKIPRIVKFFAKRPQVQERLTVQIADALSLVLDSENVAVSITAQHFCVLARGIEDQNSHMTTNAFYGKFEQDPLLRDEFFRAVKQ